MAMINLPRVFGGLADDWEVKPLAGRPGFFVATGPTITTLIPKVITGDDDAPNTSMLDAMVDMATQMKDWPDDAAWDAKTATTLRPRDEQYRDFLGRTVPWMSDRPVLPAPKTFALDWTEQAWDKAHMQMAGMWETALAHLLYTDLPAPEQPKEIDYLGITRDCAGS